MPVHLARSQTSLRSYWRNYFEQTDGLIWVVDSADRARVQDCKAELQVLLTQERLAGASLLVFANKQVQGRMRRGLMHARARACSAWSWERLRRASLMMTGKSIGRQWVVGAPPQR